MTMPLESSMVISGLGTPLLTGTISTPIVTETGGAAPSMVIRTDQNWQIQIDWNLQGSLLGTPFFTFNGEWVVRVYLESMGPSNEYEIPIGGSGAHVSVATFTPDGLSKRDYTTTIQIAPKAVDPGIYKMVIAVTYESSPGVPGPIAGFHEGGMLQLYEA
jgi:hypothetical protein